MLPTDANRYRRMLSSTRRAFLARAQGHLARTNCPAARRRLLSTLAVSRAEGRPTKPRIAQLDNSGKEARRTGSLALLLGASIKSVAEEVAKVDGVEKVIAVEMVLTTRSDPPLPR